MQYRNVVYAGNESDCLLFDLKTNTSVGGPLEKNNSI